MHCNAKVGFGAETFFKATQSEPVQCIGNLGVRYEAGMGRVCIINLLQQARARELSKEGAKRSSYMSQYELIQDFFPEPPRKAYNKIV